MEQHIQEIEEEQLVLLQIFGLDLVEIQDLEE